MTCNRTHLCYKTEHKLKKVGMIKGLDENVTKVEYNLTCNKQPVKLLPVIFFFICDVSC